jgi:hypothetical protein
MATLTSTGPVNLTSSTNWSPAQVPVAGDDLVVGADTLTLDADMVLGSVTFNNASSRLAFTGLTRSVEATNGWLVTGAIAATLITTTITTGVSLTLVGKWTASGSASSGIGITFRHFAMTGGTLNLRTVGADPSTILFDAPQPYTWSLCLTLSGGVLNTTGLIKVRSTTSYQGFILMSGSSVWNHDSAGLNEFNGTITDMISLQGSAVLSWVGDLTSLLAATSKFISSVSGSWVGTATITGDIKTSGTGWLAYLVAGSGTCYFNGKLSSDYLAGAGATLIINNGTVSWASQSRQLNLDAVLYVSVGGASFVLSGLVLNNSGKFLVDRRAGSVVVSADTQITNNSGAQFLSYGSTVLDDKVLNLSANVPTLPAVEDVAAQTVYGYAGFEQTGTGLIMDPAIISSAVLAASMATLQRNPAFVAERTLEDEKPLTFSWPNSTDTVQGQVSIDNGSYVAVAGVIAYFRSESGKYYYTLAHDAADRPAAEGTARYRFYSGSHSVYATLRTIKASPALSEIKDGLAVEATSQNILSGVSSLNNNNRGEFF